MRVAGVFGKRLDGDPTRTPPPKIASDGPSTRYAVIHTNDPIAKHPPSFPNSHTPPVCIFFTTPLRTFVFAFKLAQLV